MNLSKDEIEKIYNNIENFKFDETLFETHKNEKINFGDKIFNIYICNWYEKEIFFYIFNVYVFYLSKFKNKKCIIAFDLEYGTIDIELMQIIYHVESLNFRVIFLITPKLLENNFAKTFFLKKIISNPNILKICNGAESLDLKHLKDEIILEDKYFINFLLNYIDTKFLCNYFNTKLDTSNKFCNVYELY